MISLVQLIQGLEVQARFLELVHKRLSAAPEPANWPPFMRQALAAGAESHALMLRTLIASGIAIPVVAVANPDLARKLEELVSLEVQRRSAAAGRGGSN